MHHQRYVVLVVDCHAYDWLMVLLRLLGAAKLTSLLQSVGPKVLLVEEAGQVLEAHILASEQTLS